MRKVPKQDGLVSLADAAITIGCSTSNLLLRVRDGTLKGEKRAGFWYLTEDQVVSERRRFTDMRARKNGPVRVSRVVLDPPKAEDADKQPVPGKQPVPDKLSIIIRLTAALEQARQETQTAHARIQDLEANLTRLETELAEAKQTISSLQHDMDEATKPGETDDLSDKEVSALKATGLFPELA